MGGESRHSGVIGSASNGSRRRLLAGAAALLCAPAIVRADSLMSLASVPVEPWVADDAAFIARMRRHPEIPVMLTDQDGPLPFRAAAFGFVAVATRRGYDHWWRNEGWRVGALPLRSLPLTAAR